VKIVHFGGGALGGEKDVMEGLRLGSVHISLIGLTLMPFLDVIWGPYVFRDNDHPFTWERSGETSRSSRT
jgi:TRAP-type C4-dicarboxylate transport system substrate-binding protein